MNKKRLLKLADMLEANASNRGGVKFDLNTVINPGSLSLDAKAVPMTCGTQACAIGLAALSGAFKRDGLSYRIDKNADAEGGLFIETTMHGEEVNYDDAAVHLFDITNNEAGFLFSPSFYPEGMNLTGVKAERYVAKRIRDFVAGKVTPNPRRDDFAGF